ncbi:MAG: hypothetical protein AB8C84_10890 [Oligoflexales bacterium]
MKIYEFTYTDKQGLSDIDLQSVVSDFLEDEAENQGWEPDFSFHQTEKSELLPSGERRYHFAVLGEFQSGVDAGSPSESFVVQDPQSDESAAKPHL